MCGATHLAEAPDVVCSIRQRLADAKRGNDRRALIRPWVNFTPASRKNPTRVSRPLYGYQCTPGSVLTRLCKKAFNELVGAFVSTNQIRHMMDKDRQGIDAIKDRRGGAYHVVPTGAYEAVQDFLSTCPEKERHYTMNTDRVNTDIKVLDPKCTKGYLWSQFVKSDWMKVESISVDYLCVSQSWFSQALRTFSYHRGQYAVDRCEKCTQILESIARITKAQMRAKTPEGRKAKEDSRKLTMRYQSHLTRAKYAIDSEMDARQLALGQPRMIFLPCRPLSRDGTVHLRADMGSNLQTPRIPGGGIVHYCPQSHTVVLWLVDSSRGDKVTAFVWECREGESGPRSMMSVLMYYLERYHSGCKRLVLWADNTGKGTKCWDWLFFMDNLCREKWFESAGLRFYVKGHTFMGGNGPDALHSVLKRNTPEGVTLSTVKDWIRVIKKAGKGKWEVVHFVEKFHRNWNVFLSSMYRKPQGPRSFKIQEWRWFNFGRGPDCSGVDQDHLGEVWARHAHDEKRRFERISIQKQKRGEFDPDTFTMPDIRDEIFDMGPNPLKKTVCEGILKVMPSMDDETANDWSEILKNRLGKTEFDKQYESNFKKSREDDACDSDSGDDSDTRLRKWKAKKQKKDEWYTEHNLRPPGFRADYSGVRRLPPIDQLSKARRAKRKVNEEEKQQYKEEEKRRRKRDSNAMRAMHASIPLSRG